MPSTRPCAAFEPISPDFEVKALVESTPNFEWVVRIQADMIDHHGLEHFERLVLVHVILGGKPLVIEGYHEKLDQWTFTLQWLRDNCGSKIENARDLTKKTNVPLTIAHYLNHMALLTNQWTNNNYKDPERQRMYLKDIDCPQIWADKCRDMLPLGLFYMNESTGDNGGLGSTEEADPSGHGTRRGRGVAKAGDLMSSLPKEMRAENLMCYIGHEGTYTPAHREMCASLGHNIMVECSTGKIEDGKPTQAGSSIWLMTESKERHVVSEYWLSRLGHDIEVENHFAQINAWKAAPFKVYVVEQRVGDFILIPPLAPHQVWNRGTRTMKIAWNRTTIETLEMALNEALPRARMVCRDEQYKNKAIIYYTLQKYSKLLKLADKARQKKHSSEVTDLKIRQVEKDFRRLQALFTRILVSESFLPNRIEKNVELIPFEGYVTCSYCRCNIFNRFLTCLSCGNNAGTEDEDTYDICMDCYAMGRSCACISKLKWVEQFSWGELTRQHELYRHQILQKEADVTEKSPKSLKTELDKLGKRRTLAQICQLELQKRPWNDITKPQPPVDGVDHEEEVIVDDNGNVKKKRKVRRSEKFMRDHGRCHTDCNWEPKWKQARCSTCDKNYCYGVLFRAYDMMPQDILADPSWRCPSCRSICSCRYCRTKPGYKPFSPSGTLLGYNTKAVADPRSVESLVDFSHSNLSWIQKAGDDHEADTRRLNRRKRAAEAAKADSVELGDDYVEADNADDEAVAAAEDVDGNLLRLAQHEGIPIDPSLGFATINGGPGSPGDEDVVDENPEGIRARHEGSNALPPAPQYVIPEGGVIRSAEHAYDVTEAITYDYPDPESTLPMPLPDADAEAGQVETYKPVVPTDELHVEMINRKRKRETLDEGEKAYNPKKAVPKKPAERKSLIVRLPLNKDKLARVNRMAIIAQRALNGNFDSAAPVLGSDLSALNAASTTPAEELPLPKKARIDQIPAESHDEDFRPGRRRDRRKGLLGEHLHPPLDTRDSTRRSMRTQTVTYEVPSDEDEFNDTLPERPSRSKLATFECAAYGRQRSVSEGRFEDSKASSSPYANLDGAGSSPSVVRLGEDAAEAAGERTVPRRAKPLVSITNGTSVSSAKSAAAQRPASGTGTKMAEAVANRRAKMALESLDFDDDSEDEEGILLLEPARVSLAQK